MNSLTSGNNFDTESLPPYKDDTPAYSPSLQFYGLALLKVEFDTPWSDRNSSLKPVVVEINSNQLNLYEFSGDKTTVNAVKALFKYQNYDDGADREVAVADNSDDYFFDCDAYGDHPQSESHSKMFSKFKSHLDKKKTNRFLSTHLPPDVSHNKLLLEPTSDPVTYHDFALSYRGKLLHSYTLLNLDVGEAPSTAMANYKEDKQTHAFALVNYRNTLRLRVEYMQMLLHFWSFHGMVHWFRNMTVGRDLASSLDQRKLSTLKSIPRNFSIANNNLLEASAREALTFNPETRKMVHRESVSSADDCASCFSHCTMNSTETSASSIAASCAEACSKESCRKSHINVYGSRIICLENIYTPIEKQYISNCIPILNSFDKWLGAKLTISNYEKFLPKNNKSNVNENGKVFICLYTFNHLVRNYNKHSPLSTVGNCMDFYVESGGLIGIERS